MNTLPLLTGRSPDDVIAWRADGPRQVRDLLADAKALLAVLPPGAALLNVCQDRYRFAVGFVAGLLGGRVSLQPSSQSAETLARLHDTYPGLFCLHDGGVELHGLPALAFPDLAEADPVAVTAVPAIAADQPAAVLFTSGSTGVPQAHVKTWGKLVANGRAEAACFGFDRTPHHIVGTVPVQHSYGFESTLLLALHGGCSFWAGKPFYPQDIVSALAAVPAPRLLVTTPFHLSALLASGLELPATDLVLSATAPLSVELASRAEQRFGAPLKEIYGATETGQVASRRTTEGETWTLLNDLHLAQEEEQTWASGGHIEGRIALSDVIELLPEGRFRLLGRQADLINIAGKRTSLAYLNHQIAAIPGVADGAFFLPEETPDGVTRLCAFVVAPGVDRQSLLGELRRRLDPIFLPRPLVLVDHLPRNATGKLPRASLQALYAEKVARGD